MYIYNVTTHVEDSVHDEWIQWMQEKHIPDMLATGKFTEARMVKVMVEEDTGGQSYSVQYFTDSKATLDKYYAENAPALQREVLKKFTNKLISFRTELQIISEH